MLLHDYLDFNSRNQDPVQTTTQHRNFVRCQHVMENCYTPFAAIHHDFSLASTFSTMFSGKHGGA